MEPSVQVQGGTYSALHTVVRPAPNLCPALRRVGCLWHIGRRELAQKECPDGLPSPLIPCCCPYSQVG